jgi:hypothetical protein
VLYQVPCSGTGAKTWPLTQAKLDEWTQAFPAVDVKAELRKSIQWLKDNPTKIKTHRGTPAFFGRWLSNAQDRTPTTPHPQGGSHAQHHRSRTDQNFAAQLAAAQAERGPAQTLSDAEVRELWGPEPSAEGSENGGGDPAGDLLAVHGSGAGS